jgi:vacuolar iron transporter family protein
MSKPEASEQSALRVVAEEVGGYKSCDAARAAFRANDIEASRREHMKPMHQESHSSNASEYIKSVVFGGLDGIMTTFAIIAAAAGSNGNYATVLIFGFSNVIADGFSMGFGEFVSGEAERDNAAAERRREEWEVENSFDLEVDEMVQIYMSKGLSFDDAHTIVGIISKDRKMFVDFMMVEELGLLVDLDDAHGPKKQGAVMFASFLLFGAIPLLAYLPGKGQGTDAVFVISCVLTMISLIVLGSVKGFLAGLSITRSAAFMVLNGTISGLVSFLSGHLIEAALQKEVHASPPPI